MDPLVQTALAAIERRDWDRLKQVLHPYLHWTDGDVKVRGRANVLAHLAGESIVDAPDSVELRDNQIYRWTADG